MIGTSPRRARKATFLSCIALNVAFLNFPGPGRE
jgi:hypothetical protein